MRWLPLPRSSAAIEGTGNRITVIKRQTCGRFDPLHQRIFRVA